MSSTSSATAPPSSSAANGVGVGQLPPNQLYVHEVQRGNPLLAHIKNIRWSFTKDILPDYAMSSACALFLSLKYHFRHPKVTLKKNLLLMVHAFIDNRILLCST
jgi:DNA excision repair protein ERCC-1